VTKNALWDKGTKCALFTTCLQATAAWKIEAVCSEIGMGKQEVRMYLYHTAYESSRSAGSEDRVIVQESQTGNMFITY
jgi:hypothetical protein